MYYVSKTYITDDMIANLGCISIWFILLTAVAVLAGHHIRNRTFQPSENKFQILHLFIFIDLGSPVSCK
jgi:hypothetical protein